MKGQIKICGLVMLCIMVMNIILQPILIKNKIIERNPLPKLIKFKKILNDTHSPFDVYYNKFIDWNRRCNMIDEYHNKKKVSKKMLI